MRKKTNDTLLDNFMKNELVQNCIHESSKATNPLHGQISGP